MSASPVDLQAQIEVVGGRRVLLDDEGAGADATDGELLVALDLDRLDLHLGNLCQRRAPRRKATSASTAGSFPSAWTSTSPCSPLRTQPSTPSSPARVSVASRKPTPCTPPRTAARSAVRQGPFACGREGSPAGEVSARTTEEPVEVLVVPMA